jgi:hypothetical protein
MIQSVMKCSQNWVRWAILTVSAIIPPFWPLYINLTIGGQLYPLVVEFGKLPAKLFAETAEE